MRERHAQDQKATREALANLREALPENVPREAMDSVSEVTISKDGLKAQGPPWVLLAISVLAFAAFVAWLLLRH